MGLSFFLFGPAVVAEGREPVVLDSSGATAAPLIVYPPSTNGGDLRPMMLMLHGMCDVPENECPWFAGPGTADRYLACPRADLSCPGGGAIWSGASRVRVDMVQRSRDDVERAFVGSVSGEGAILAGFSLGAFVALDVAQSTKGQWPHVLLVGARVWPDPARLQAAGVKSILLASGDWDITRDHMKKQATRLREAGLRASYQSLGPVGHRFPRDMDQRLARATEWLLGEDS
jgi:predicted esterase